jgi:aspartate/methionine/tyrosine aminotransferase
MDAKSAFVTTSMGGEAYAQWVRRAIGHARGDGDGIVPLFDSSVEEPVELLREVVERGFRAPITPKYRSVFVSGNPFVVAALSERYGVPEPCILPTTGATSGLSLVYRTFLRPGDRVLVETPGFDLFGDIGRALGVEVDHFHRAPWDFGLDEVEIAEKITPRTRLVVLSDLHNPSGMLLKPDVIARVARIAADRGAHLVVDEVYGDYASKAARPGSAALLSPNIIAVSSLTKIFGLSTLRCGWVIAAEPLLAPIREVSDQFEFGVSKLSHAVAALVLEESERFEAYSRAVVETARPIIRRHLDAWRAAGLVEGRLPDHGCIFFPRLCGVEDSIDFSDWLADRHGVVVAPGEFFGAAGHVRVGYAHAPDVLETGLARLAEGMRDYPGRHGKPARARLG